jgi:predicted MFS family arabinose efflux permease
MLQSPLSCTRLLTRHGPKVRTLGLLLMLMTLPSFMGDFFQVFAKQEWQLSTKSFSTFLALYGIVGIAANTASSLLVKAWGIRRFTAVAILSRLFATVATIVFGYRGTVIGLAVGFLGSAQAIGIVAALISEGTKSGLPQGEMAGEQAALVALLKVIGPIWYSTLYLQGQRWMQTHYLPFFFNVTLSIMALVMSQIHL